MSDPAGWNVLITSRLFTDTPQAREILVEGGCVPTILERFMPHGDAELAGDELVELLRGMDAFITGSAKLTRDVLRRSPSLKLVARRGVGYDSVDVEAAAELGIGVTITAGANQDAVADYAMTLLLALDRGLVPAFEDFRAGKWIPRMGTGMRGKTLGIVGLGRIGKSLTRRALPFGLRVIAADPVRDDAFAAEHGVTYVELDRLLSEADFVAIHATLNPTTHHLINAGTLRRMKPSAILVNTARGPIVDEPALADALRAGTIRAAGLDVFAREPDTNTPLAGLPNALLTPHNAASTAESYDQMNLAAARTVVGLSRGIAPERDCIVVEPRRR